MSKNLPLSNGLFAIVDEEDFERACQFKWHLNGDGYVQRHTRKSDGSRTGQLLSRFIMNPPKGLDVDHLHGNLLDNRKSQLRLCTRQQNSCNRGKGKNNTSGFKGVFWHKHTKKWRAQICVNRRLIHLGYFRDTLEASAAYGAAALKYHGEFSRTY